MKTPTVFSLWRGRALSLCVAGLAAALVLVFGPAWLTGTSRAVAAYDLATVTLIAVVWAVSVRQNAEETRQRASVADIGRILMSLVVFVCVGFGLYAAVVILGHGPHVNSHSEKLFVDALAIVSVVAGWVLIHTMYIFRYAHLYYYDADGDDNDENGLDFPGTKTPNDIDFAYYSFVIGMTFQVSDVDIRDAEIRRVTLEHALISFAYNTAIVAFGINILSGLVH